MLEITGFPLFAFIMYAHSQQWFDDNIPTTINRILTVLFLTVLTVCAYILNGYHYVNYIGFYILAGFALWIIPGHMSYISNALGENKNPRWLGLLQITAREALGMPLVVWLCYLTNHAYWPCMGFLLMGLPYFINGLVLRGKWYNYAVSSGQAMIGMIIWEMVIASLRY